MEETTFTHKRPVRTGNGAGGKQETLSTIGEVTGRIRFYDRLSQKQLEQTPGLRVQNLKVVIFDRPYEAAEAISAKDVLEEADATAWRVRHTRLYEYTFQVDVELIV
jgi:hypothetical protein